MRQFNSRENPEDAAELEREAQVKQMLQDIIIFDAHPREPGAFIKKYGKRYSRLSELKPHHFNHPKLG